MSCFSFFDHLRFSACLYRGVFWLGGPVVALCTPCGRRVLMAAAGDAGVGGLLWCVLVRWGGREIYV
jgi:hypothetical protein